MYRRKIKNRKKKKKKRKRCGITQALVHYTKPNNKNMTDQNNYYEANINLQYWIKTNLTGAHCSINYQNMLLNWKKLMVSTTEKRNQQVKKDR